MIQASSSVSDNEVPSLELTPLIDIVFIVIVFLLITANAPLLKLPVQIPEATENPSADVISEETLVITVASDENRWALGEDTYEEWNELKSALMARMQSQQSALNPLSISIATDNSATAESLVKVMSFLNEHQLKNVQILMQQPN
ncbi:ExbD/TolR family protein [Litoribrevibacter albus]|uniref:Biopolymer transporter ExbD n=1 Tax=Litoribrevibacter albus TaxID=1473156 RepID=A0AA37S772_9GAMM|nr:biopolymer transporter ExbD [Litoribrevibacter albus]GLQ30336.1 biopolymer transporter ExbD [Litoribrevibacter albus]